MVTFSGGVAPHSINMGDGTILSNRTSPVYYTYGSAGTRTVTVTDSSAVQQQCQVSVTTSPPTSGDGGEVAT